MDKFIRWGATFSVNMACYGNKGVLSIPIYSYIDKSHKITIDKITISDYNNIDLYFTTAPQAKPESISFTIIENGSSSKYDTSEGYRENYNERYD